MRVFERLASAIVLDRDGISASQTPGGAGNLLLNGVGIVDGFATLNPPRPVSIYSAGDVSTNVFTITGTDRAGTPFSETVTGVNGTTVATLRVFKTVTSISINAVAAFAVEAGWTALSYTSWIILGNYQGHYTDRIVAIPSGTVNFDVEVTTQNMWRDRVTGDYPDDLVDLRTAQTARTDDVLQAPYAAVRLIMNSAVGNGSVKLRVLPSKTV